MSRRTAVAAFAVLAAIYAGSASLLSACHSALWMLLLLPIAAVIVWAMHRVLVAREAEIADNLCTRIYLDGIVRRDVQ